MRLAIVGSRDGLDWPAADRRIRELVENPEVTAIVSGGARGIDRMAEQAAKRAGKEAIIIRADWKRHGKRAGFMRNPDIVREADRVVALWNGTSRGTANTIQLARDAGKLWKVIHLPAPYTQGSGT